jgi:hypothetical protein
VAAKEKFRPESAPVGLRALFLQVGTTASEKKCKTRLPFVKEKKIFPR